MQYQKLQSEIDELTARLQQRYDAHLQCRAGCSSCCHHHLSLFPVEAAQVKTALQNLPQPTQNIISAQAKAVIQNEARGADVACPLLVDDNCAIYNARPIICRTQGLPLLYEAEDGAHEVDFCPLNFTTDEAIATLDENHLVALDHLNLRLALANIEYCQTHNLDPNQRIKIAELC